MTGDPLAAIAETRAAVAAAADEGLEGDALAFTHVDAGELLRATGDEAGARSAYEAALEARPGHPAALVGLARLDAFDGDLDAAIARLDAALAAIPNPDWLALRADLLALPRRAPATPRRPRPTGRRSRPSRRSPATRPASTTAAWRCTSPTRASTRRARSGWPRRELAVRPDVYGYDTLAWALLADGRADRGAGARWPRRSPPAPRTRGSGTTPGSSPRPTATPRRRATHLTDALALGAALDPVAARAGRRRPWRTCREARRPGRALLAVALLGRRGARSSLAHPLGNFTVNHYAGIRVEPDRVLLDVVIDAAEIPTFQLVADRDRDGDGVLTGAELDGLAADRCLAVGRDLSLDVDGAAGPLALTAAGIAFPAGNGGLATMRLSCAFEAPAAVGAATSDRVPRRLRGRPHRLARDHGRRRAARRS